MMISFFTHYPYLCLALIVFACAVAGFVTCPRQRCPMLISALISAPYALASVVFVPEYWNPIRIACFLTGPEDIIFSLSNGGLVWLLGVWPLRKRIALRMNLARMFWRTFVFTMLCGMITMSLWLCGLRIMTATLTSIVIMLLPLLVWLCRDLWLVAVSGAIGFSVFYAAMLIMVNLLFPHFCSQWNIENLSGYLAFGFPIEELIWAFAFGAFWPLFMVYILDVHIVELSPAGDIPGSWSPG